MPQVTNDTLRMAVCTVCVERFFMHDMGQITVAELIQSGMLIPFHSHSVLVLTEGMLLHTLPDCFSSDQAGHPFTFTCKAYFLQLQKKKTLVQSLANGLWVSNVPLVLRILTLPGWILIVRHFLVTYIITLYLKKKGTFMVKHWLALQMFILSILFKVRIRIFLKRPLQVRFPLTKATSSNQSFLLKARLFQSGNYYATTPFLYEHLFCISTKLIWSALSCRSLFLKKPQCRVHILEKGSCITMGINQKL